MADQPIPSGFTDADRALLDQIGAGNRGLRAGLCTLARLGVAWRRSEPDRTAAWLDQLGPHPLYKAGQVLFDLLEWEDFMLDGPAPEIDTAAAAALARQVAQQFGLPEPTAAATDLEALPDLEMGFYLYRDVILGLLWLGLR